MGAKRLLNSLSPVSSLTDVAASRGSCGGPRHCHGAHDHYRSAKKSVCTNCTSGTLTLPTIAKIANITTQSNPMLIPSDGSSFACRFERRSPDMATLLVIGTFQPSAADERRV